MKPRRPGRANFKRRIADNTSDEAKTWLRANIRYGGNPEHKGDPGEYRLNPPTAPRLDKTLCDPTDVRTPRQALNILKTGIDRGLVSEQKRGEFPQNIWSVIEMPDEVYVIEAQLENQTGGAYHAYPLDRLDPFRDFVLERWYHGT